MKRTRLCFEEGLNVNACSLSQLEAFGKEFPGAEIGLRFNPGLGSGGTGKTNVGGPSSSFGIWHELLPKAGMVVREPKSSDPSMAFERRLRFQLG